jgi:hypothetical protein
VKEIEEIVTMGCLKQLLDQLNEKLSGIRLLKGI